MHSTKETSAATPVSSTKENRSLPLRDQLRATRAATRRVTAPLSAEDCQPQSMPDASPVKWHLAHTTWFFETFVLEPSEADHEAVHPDYRVLFNSYYQTVGAQHPRPQRGLLTRPSLDEVWDYRTTVEQRVDEMLTSESLDAAALDIVELGIHHEQQHQELLLTDVKHLFSQSCLQSRYADIPPTAEQPIGAARWTPFEGGVQRVGCENEGFSFDNEMPRHATILEPYKLANRLVTNGEYLEFINDNGYNDPSLWLSDGWATIQELGWQAPLYWTNCDGAWQVFTLSGTHPLRCDEPVTHLSFYEADAFARWAGARLPTESEWELAAGGVLKEGNFVESGLFHPKPCHATGAPNAVTQLFGDVWEWTQSPYTPYPGYKATSGALGEYNGKFMANQIVLRGGSCVTPRSHIRATYRNFFPPDARWQFSGLRLANSA